MGDAASVTVHAPGKLVLGGEYAITRPGGRALVLAVGPGVVAEAWPQPGLTVELPWGSFEGHGEGGALHLRPERGEARFVLAGLRVLSRRVGGLGLGLRVSPAGWERALPPGSHKPGLGGSAAALVASVVAGARALGLEMARAELLAECVAAHREAQGGVGSGIDVAASLLGGALEVQADEGGGLKALPLEWPRSWELVVALGRGAVSTPARLRRVGRLWEEHPAWAQAWVEASDGWVDHLTRALTGGDASAFCHGLVGMRAHQRELMRAARLTLEDRALTAMVRAARRHGAARGSGSGGGDCGFALAAAPGGGEGLRADLLRAGLTLLPLELAPPGALGGDLRG